MDVKVNVLAILCAVVSSMIVGSIWYAKGVFGKLWMKLIDMTDKKAKEGCNKAIAISIVASLITAYILAHVTYLSNSFFEHSFLQDALTTAFWIWLAFTAARIVTHDAFEQRPVKLTFLTIGNEFVTLMVMGLIIGLFGI